MDAVLGTTSYEEIAGAIREALKGEKTLVFKDIDAPVGKETKTAGDQPAATTHFKDR